MKKLVLMLGLMGSLSACKTYMVSTVSSSNILQQEQNGEFTFDSDSVNLKYSFAGENMPMKVEILNKLKEPMYVNWERSALVIGDKGYSFVDDNIQLSATVKGSSYEYRQLGVTDTQADISGTAKVSRNETFVPPLARVSRTIYALNDIKSIAVADSSFKRLPMNRLGSSEVVYTKTAKFTEAASPVKFRSFITLYTLKDNQPQPRYYQQEFFVSEMTRSSVNPLNITDINNKLGAAIINEKTTGFAKALTVVAVVGGVSALAATEQALEKNDKGHH